MSSKVVVYVASDVQAEAFKSSCASSGIPIRVGTLHGMDRPGYFDALGNRLMSQGGHVDAVVFDQQSIAEQLGMKALVSSIAGFIKDGVCDVVPMVVIDPNHDINRRGREYLNEQGVRVLHDIGELGPDFRSLSDERNAQDEQNGITYDDDGTRYVNGVRDLPDDDMPDTPDNIKLDEQNADPFAELKNGDVVDIDSNDSARAMLSDVSDDFVDPFSDEDDARYSLEQNVDKDDMMLTPAGSNAEGGDASSFDPFSSLRGQDGPDADLFSGIIGDDGDDDSDEDDTADDDAPQYTSDLPLNDPNDVPLHGFSGDFTEDDLAKIAKTYENPAWNYDEINEGLSSKKRLFGKKSSKGGLVLGEVEDTSFANSTYIAERHHDIHSYSPPSESKIIVCSSQSGGSGKTTVATMLAAQLTWYFNRELLMQETMNMRSRILVMSLNEFDDISVKGIGYGADNPLGDENDGANVAELKRKITECGGTPEWDDISYCFKTNPSNYVMYLPSTTLKEKFDTDEDITMDDYKQIITVCRRFFNFIVIDTPDVFFDQRNHLMQFAFQIADVICMVIEPTLKDTLHLYRFLDGLKAKNNKMPLDRNSLMLVVNKCVTAGNPYVGYTHGGYIAFDEIANTCSKRFFKIVAIPMTDQFMNKNILFGNDQKVKQAAMELTDGVLEIIDRHDHTNGM